MFLIRRPGEEWHEPAVSKFSDKQELQRIPR